MVFQGVGHGAQHDGARGAAGGVPDGLRGAGGGEGGVDVGRRGFGGLAQDARAVGRRPDLGRGGSRPQHAADDGAGGQGLPVHRGDRPGQPVPLGLHRQVHACRVQPVGPIDVAGRGDAGVPPGLCRRGGHGIDHHLFGRNPLVQQGVDEGGVGPVLQ